MHMCHCTGTRLKIQSKQGQRQWMVTWIKCGEGSGTWDSALSALLTMDGFIKTRYTFIYNYPFYRIVYLHSALGSWLIHLLVGHPIWERQEEKLLYPWQATSWCIQATHNLLCNESNVNTKHSLHSTCPELSTCIAVYKLDFERCHF